MTNKFKHAEVLILRFLRVAASGAISSMMVLQFAGVNTLKDVPTFLSSLLAAGITGAIAGLLVALDKYLRIKVGEDK